MQLTRRAFNASLLATSAAVSADVAFGAERPKDTLVIVSEMGPNGLDTMVPTANDHSRMVNWQAYDRLVSHGRRRSRTEPFPMTPKSRRRNWQRAGR
jgi:peptide/nickel transport system substrate-binding protein